MNKILEENYSLCNDNNYKYEYELLHSADEIFCKYKYIINCYLEHFVNSNYTTELYTKNALFYNYLLDKGITTIKNVFNIILLYTKNLELTEYYSTTVIYYYIEFLGQNSQQDVNKIDYNNASLFSYSKTIYKLNRAYIKTDPDEFHASVLYDVDKMLSLYQTIINLHIKKYTDDKTNSINDKQLLIEYIETSIEKCVRYILKFASSAETRHVNDLTLQDIYDYNIID